ncbi:hypothetical protein BU17DRAFT_61726 [Hysterangium stoloniferum]|nr:hypothetical protein BU17DRAFT_61726 [Hysterangium stoloniferum]
MDPSWCPGCDRLILPKRYIVPVSPVPNPPPLPSQEQDIASSSDSDHNPPPPPAPTPVPSSPEVRKKPLDNRARRLGGGLVHGTGRVKLGGGLKPRVEKKSAQVTAPAAGVVAPVSPTPAPAPAPAPVAAAPTPKKTRVIISQEPTPLYCSEECRSRDLKNSYIESESGGFTGAPAAMNHLARLELVQVTFERCMQSRRSSSSSNSSPPLSTPPVPPNSLADAPSQAMFRSSSMSSTSTAASTPSLKAATSNASAPASASALVDESTTRAPKRRTPLSRMPSWGSPSKAALAPPAYTPYTYTASSSSIDSSLSGVFEPMPSTSTTTSDGGKKKKHVSFAGDAKVPLPQERERDRVSGSVPPQAPAHQRHRPAMHPRTQSYSHPHYTQTHTHAWLPRRRNPLLDADSLRAAVSVSPKDRIQPSSLPTTQQPSTAPSGSGHSASTPSLAHAIVDTNPRRAMSAANKYHVAMWPEDEKRMTESARVHGALLRAYARRFGPREGRSLCWSALLREEEEIEREALGLTPDGSNSSSSDVSAEHDAYPDSSSPYWEAYEAKQAALRARRKALEMMQRLEEERVICELLGGQGMREEDQPQARRMKRMAYDGMPGPPEERGLEYRFDKFLYEVRWDGGKEGGGERKRLFNFEE